MEYDTLRKRWRVEPGGYERRELADALAQATGERRDAKWIVTLLEKVTKDKGRPAAEA